MMTQKEILEAVSAWDKDSVKRLTDALDQIYCCDCGADHEECGHRRCPYCGVADRYKCTCSADRYSAR